MGKVQYIEPIYLRKIITNPFLGISEIHLCLCLNAPCFKKKEKKQTRKLQNPTDLYVNQGMVILKGEGMLVQPVLAPTSHGKYQRHM